MWQDKYLKEAKDDLDKLDPDLREIVLAGIKKVRQNPLSQSEGGYGKPLGNKGGNNLTGFFKIKYKGIGIRVVYTLVRDVKVMNIVVVSKRDETYCYETAAKRKRKYGDNVFKDMID
ncbi:MAG: type II toxin-antitoxin system RelE/ParE family toxin [Firmicutes bacterium]|nr:type II toxin-antitoxin system RelE/ParE family toxin [Bacillota bacterium]